MSVPDADKHDHFFHYTSGRWLYDEQTQFAKRHVEFNIQALQQVAEQALCSRCVKMTKLPEGLYNKVLSLRMENGKEVLVRIPNPNAGHPHSIVASEVATLDFLRNVLEIPVPKVYRWSSHDASQPNLVGAEYMVMEKIPGRQLSEVWPTMSEAQRFGLVKSLVHIEKKLAETKLLKYGSLHYRDYTEGLSLEDTAVFLNPTNKDTSRFIIAQTTERSFWEDEKRNVDIDRGPWKTTGEYFSAVANREIACLQISGTQKSQDRSLLSGRLGIKPEMHVRLLQQFVRILPHILPEDEDVTYPTLWHHDLHSHNIFVEATDTTKISGIIDWQAVWAAPLFMQARFPSVFDCDGPYPWGAVEPKLPEGFAALPEMDKKEEEIKLSEIRLKKFYEMASRKFNPKVFQAMDMTRNDNDPTTFVFHLVGRSLADGPIPLRELLIQIYQKWDRITRGRGERVACPISFTEDEITKATQEAKAWAAAYNEFNSLRTRIAGKDGWVSHHEYEDAMHRFEAYKKPLEKARMQLERVGGREST